MFTRIAICCLSVVAFGCSSGGNSGGTNADAHKSTGDDAGSDSFACRNKSTSYGDGHHNPGMDCMDSCHNHGFTIAGTAYTATSGSTAAAGATITVVDNAGHSMDLVVQSNGNFYTATAVTFPLTIYASECPSVQMMTANVTANGSTVGCNQTNCHASGSSQGHIHIP